MKTIGFTNRERIMIGDEIGIFMEYLQNKLPEANYFSENSDTEDFRIKTINPTVSSIKSILSHDNKRKWEDQSERKNLKLALQNPYKRT